MGIIAGGVTYAVLVALFPGLAALVSVYGLVADPAQIQEQMNAMAGLMPAESQKLIGDELKQLTQHASGTLSIGVVVGFLIALWSASRGVSALITALNIAYGEKETRGFVKFNLLTIALTIGLIVAGLIAIGLIAGMPAVLGLIGVGQTTRWLLLILEWPVLSAFIILVLAVLYRFAPNRDAPQWRWISPGAVTATLAWIIASILFTVYVTNFNSYEDIRLARRDHYLAYLALHFGLRRAPRCRNKRRGRAADAQRHDHRVATANGTTARASC